jgi:hypothetical protein
MPSIQLNANFSMVNADSLFPKINCAPPSNKSQNQVNSILQDFAIDSDEPARSAPWFVTGEDSEDGAWYNAIAIRAGQLNCAVPKQSYC